MKIRIGLSVGDCYVFCVDVSQSVKRVTGLWPLASPPSAVLLRRRTGLSADRRVRNSVTASLVSLGACWAMGVAQTPVELDMLKALPQGGFFITTTTTGLIRRMELSNPLVYDTLAAKDAFWAQVSPDGSRIAYRTVNSATSGTELRVMAADGSSKRKVVDGPKYANLINWTESSSRFVVCGGEVSAGAALGENNGPKTGSVYLVDADKGTSETILSYPVEGSGDSCVTDADVHGDMMIYRRGQGDVYMRNWKTRQEVMLQKKSCDCGFSPSGDLCVSNVTGHMSLNVYERVRDEWKLKYNHPVPYAGDYFWSNHEDWLIVKSQTVNDIFLMHVPTGGLTRVTFLGAKRVIGSLHLGDGATTAFVPPVPAPEGLSHQAAPRVTSVARYFVGTAAPHSAVLVNGRRNSALRPGLVTLRPVDVCPDP